MASQASRKLAPDAPVIPDRLYFKIGDVARICGVETYVLRFWETQFPQLKPNKSGTGQRLYRRRDVERALEIKRLVHGAGYTLAGARQALESGGRKPAHAETRSTIADGSMSAQPMPTARMETSKKALAQIRSELRALAEMLGSPQATLRRERAKMLRVQANSESLFPL
jgi:DNA-binding transcriptional MerR regulator